MSSADVPRTPPLPAWRAWLQLARISNTPTVVSSAIAGAVLATAAADAGRVAIVAVAMALFYTAGMILNDLLDVEVDRRERPERPLPSGVVSPRVAGVVVAALLAAGLALLAPLGWRPLAAGVALVGLIYLYDAWHKGNVLSPVLMGGCRALVYVVAALAVAGAVSLEVAGGAVMLLVYIVGLTEAAKAEGRGLSTKVPHLAVLAPIVYWAFFIPIEAVVLLVAFAAWTLYALRLMRERRHIGTGVTRLIAGVALFDALAVTAGDGSLAAVLTCLAAFAVTLLLQTRIAGT